MQPSHSAADVAVVNRLLPITAGFLWVVSIVFVLWVDTHRDHPNYNELGIIATVLIMVAVPASFGAAVSERPALQHRDRASAWAGVLSEWAFLAVCVPVMFFRYFEESVYYLTHPDKWGLNALIVADILFPPIAFGLVGGLMGFAGGVVAMRVRSRVARRGSG